MFKEINDKINFSFELEFPCRKEQIIFLLKHKAAEQNPLLFFLPGRIDFNEIRFLDDRIEINRRPGTFTAFRPTGRIVMTLTELNKDSTRLRCEVMPGNNTIPVMKFIQVGVLVLWAIGWMLLGWRLDPLPRYLIPICVLILVFTIQFLKYRGDRQALIDYSKLVIKVIKDEMGTTFNPERKKASDGFKPSDA